MKNASTILIVIIICCFVTNLYAQIGGNQLYQNNSTSYDRNPVETVATYSSDTTLIVTSRIMMHQKADYYLMTIGVNQMAKTVVEANQKMNTRIDNVLKKIKNIGVKKEDIYVDFISKTKLYDHKITDGDVVEYFDGFSIRKNIIIKVRQPNKIDIIIDAASEEGIHDIVKVDYVSKDLETISAQLLAESMKIIRHKKQVFEKYSSIKLSGKYRIAYKKLRVYYPKNLYKQYNEAFETSIVNNYYRNNYTKKETRKEKTFYYDGISPGADKIIDDISPVVGIQYIMEIQMVYELER